MSLIKRKTDGFSITERKGEQTIQSSIFDGKGNLLGKAKDDLLYNINGIDRNGKEIDPQKRLETIGKTAQKNISDLLIWTNFKQPAKELIRITQTDDLYDCLGVSNKFINFGYADNTIIFNTQNILKDLGINSLSLGGAVADCGGICGNYNNGEIISVSHAGWGGITNGVIEQLIYTYMAELGKKEFQKVQFDFSPMAGINYEWNKNVFNNNLPKYIQNLEKEYKTFLEKEKEIKIKLERIQKNNNKYNTEIINKLIRNYKILVKKTTQLKNELNVFSLNQKFIKIAEEYNIDYIKDKIVEESSDPKKVIFFLDRLIKRIFLENGANIEQLNFHKEQTTDLNNSWPSYRIHSLGKKEIITPDMTLKGKSGLIPDSRLGVFNTVYKKLKE